MGRDPEDRGRLRHDVTGDLAAIVNFAELAGAEVERLARRSGGDADEAAWGSVRDDLRVIAEIAGAAMDRLRPEEGGA